MRRILGLPLLFLGLVACQSPSSAVGQAGTATPLAPQSPVARTASPGGASSADLDLVSLPPGFRIDLFAEVPGARSLARGDQGTVFVGTRGDKVYALVDSDSDGRADRVSVVDEDLHSPNGVAFREGALYVAEISRILRYDGVEDHLDDPPEPAVVTDALPTDEWHGWKFIAFGPDGLLYVPVGAPCNVCLRDDPRYASILRMKPDGSGTEVFAHGVRNTVGFDWNPKTGVMWFTDNGRDMLGDDAPPDELNRAPEAGLHFGFPFCHGGTIPDPNFGRERSCDEFTPPARRLGPHVASLGMRFYQGTMFPEEFRNDVFIAEHGSWNRSTPIGYRVTRVKVQDGQAVSYEVFAEGWLADSKVRGRPVDLLVLPDGSMLLSDDHAGKVYRITYEG